MTKYKHPYHNSGRKTAIELWVENFDSNVLPTLKRKREIKTFLKLKEDMILENEKNKQEGIVTIGDIEILVDEIRNAKSYTDENGNEIEYTEEKRREEVDELEDIVEKSITAMGIKYIRTYPKK